MKSYIALVPGILSILTLYWLWIRGTRFPVAQTFLKIYLPTVLLLPHRFVAEISFFHWNFCEFAIFPIFVAFLFSNEKPRLLTRPGVRLLDFLFIAYAIVCAWSEYWGTHEWSLEIYYVSNRWGAVLSHVLLNAVIPYYLVRKIIHPNGLSAQFARTVVVCTFISILLSSYEWVTSKDIQTVILENFFSSQNIEPLEPSLRFDLVRISGPYGHPIAFGLGIAIALFWNLWLMREKMWKNRFFLMNNSTVLGSVFMTVLSVGLLLTISRGPIYSFLLALLPTTLGYVRHRKLSLAVISFVLFGMAIFSWQNLTYYSDYNRELAPSDLENNNAYRADLWDVYSPVIAEKPLLGWSELEWPKAFRMASIDNQYLFLTVIHGAIATGIFCLILAIAQGKLFWTGLKIPEVFRRNRSFNFTLFGQLFMMTICYLTVYMHSQNEVLTFMTVGLAQGFLDTSPIRQEFYG